MANVYGIEYTVKNSKGEVVDSNKGEAPLEFVGGKGRIIPGLEKAVEEMEVGEEKEVKIPASEAYGERNEELVEKLPKEQFEGIELQKGMTLYGQTPDGQVIGVVVKDFDDESVTVDYNHPLAGEDLTFDVKLVSKREATADEALSGEVGGHQHCGSGNCGCGH
ncbi:MAG: peptidylprolyl isomerase [Epsilonproteobacteria bacterium]|nr:peptidylprolyl isomerase [Campylobacterota bacterium]